MDGNYSDSEHGIMIMSYDYSCDCGEQCSHYYFHTNIGKCIRSNCQIRVTAQ